MQRDVRFLVRNLFITQCCNVSRYTVYTGFFKVLQHSDRCRCVTLTTVCVHTNTAKAQAYVNIELSKRDKTVQIEK